MKIELHDNGNDQMHIHDEKKNEEKETLKRHYHFFFLAFTCM